MPALFTALIHPTPEKVNSAIFRYRGSLCNSQNTKMLSVRFSALLTEGSAKAFQLTRI